MLLDIFFLAISLAMLLNPKPCVHGMIRGITAVPYEKASHHTCDGSCCINFAKRRGQPKENNNSMWYYIINISIYTTRPIPMGKYKQHIGIWWWHMMMAYDDGIWWWHMMMAYGGMFEALPFQTLLRMVRPGFTWFFTKAERIIINHQNLSGWWFQPLWKIWKSAGVTIPNIINIWENKSHVPNHQPVIVVKPPCQDSFKAVQPWQTWLPLTCLPPFPCYSHTIPNSRPPMGRMGKIMGINWFHHWESQWQWPMHHSEFQEPKMELSYHIKPLKLGVHPMKFSP